MKDWLDMILKGGRVARFHTKPVLKEETVAAHSFLVAWVCALVEQPRTPSANLLLAALAHDLPEFELGDMPSPAKRKLNLGAAYRAEEANMFRIAGMPDYEGQLSKYEAEVLKFADNFAGYLKCVYELQMGNTLLLHTAERYHEYLCAQLEASRLLPEERCSELMNLAPIPGESNDRRQ